MLSSRLWRAFISSFSFGKKPGKRMMRGRPQRILPRSESLEPRLLLTVNPAGSEFLVNTFTTGAQRTWDVSPQTVAIDADGDFVVTWSSNLQDGGNYGVYAQRYNAAGVAQGTELRVNSFTTGSQFFSTVASDADGDFVVSWTSRNQDGSSYGIFAQRYNASGVAQGSEFRANSFTSNSQSMSTVAMDADGDFVVTWSSLNQDGGGYGVYAQRYNALGVAQGTEFRVNSFTTGNQVFSTVAMDADGDFVITWSSFGQDGGSYGIFAQRYNAAGAAQGTEFRINSHTTGQQRNSTVAMDADGDFVVSWSSNGQDGGNYGIFAQRYNAAGVALGTEFRVNEFTTSDQRYSTVTSDADGDFVIVWSSNQDGGGNGVYAQLYNAAGVVQQSEFRVNTFTTNSQSFPAVATDTDGDFVVAWSSNGQDGSGFGVYAQRYDAPPSVTVNQAVGQLDPTSNSPIQFTVVFSDPVTGFTPSDVSFTGSTAPGTLVASISGPGPTYTVSVSGMTGGGTVVVSLPAGAANDAGGNLTLASTSTDNVVTYNGTLIIDDGDPGYTAVAVLNRFVGTGGGGAGTDGYNGDLEFDFNTTSGGATVATWTTPSLPSGLYRVSATWPGDANRSPDVSYTISSSASSATQTVHYNQIYAPDAINLGLGITNGSHGFVVDGGKTFTDIGPDYLLSSGGTITVTLHDHASFGFTIADAVRFERVGDVAAIDIAVLDGAALLNDGDTLAVGSGTLAGPAVTKTLTITNVGVGPGTLNLSALTTTGPFTVSAPGSSTLAPGASTTVIVSLPTSSVGVFTGTLNIPSNDPDEAALTLSLTGSVLAPITTTFVDDGDPGFVAHTPLSHFTSVGYASTVAEVGVSDFRFDLANVGNGASIASWTSGTLTPGYYRVSATWLGDGNRSPNVTYNITGGAAPASASFNQQITPSAFSASGVNWGDIAASYLVPASGTLTVTLVDHAPSGFAFADAIRFERIADLAAVDIRVNDGATELPQNGTLSLGTAVQLAANLSKTLTITNDGASSPLNLGSLSSTGPFLVSAPGVSVLNPGDSTTLTVQLPTTSTGTQTGTLSIPSDDPDENPFVLNLTGTITPIGGIVDDGDTGYVAVASLTRFVGPGGGGPGTEGYNGDLEFDFSTAANGQTVATWTSALLPAGTYRVSATWPGDSNRSPQVTYTITNSATAATQSHTMNQIYAPDVVNIGLNVQNGTHGFIVDGGKTFADIGPDYVLSSPGTITVTLVDDAPAGFAIADAVRFERLGPPQLALGGQAANVATATATTSDLQGVFLAALEIVRNTPRGQAYASVLQNITLDVQDLAPGVLGTVNGQTIVLDINAAGHGWFIDPTPQTHEEFVALGNSTLFAIASGPASNRIDALSTLIHELGHVLGLPDEPTGASSMTAELATNTRLLPTLDSAFASLIDVSP